MESESLVHSRGGESSSYGTSRSRSRSFGSMAAAHTHSSSTSLNSVTSTFDMSSQRPFLLPPLIAPSESTASFMSLTRSVDIATDENSNFNFSSKSANEQRVYLAAQEAGQHAFGVVAVDVWTFDHGTLVHVPGGFWVNPVFAKRHPSDAMERIVDSQHPNYATPLPQVPGAGLGGYFWALGSTERVIWRDLKAITSDPLQPPYRRMTVLEEAGFGKATGIFFDVLGHRGVVIYLTRANASESMLNDPTNLNYLKVAAQHIGTSSALSKPRQLTIEAREERVVRKCRVVATKIQCVNAFSSLRRSLSTRSLQGLSKTQSVRGGSPAISNLLRKNHMAFCWNRFFEFSRTIRSNSRERIASLIEKCRGCNIMPPPPVPLSNALRAFVGSFFGFLALYALSALARHENEDRIVLAPFGALMTLLFSLTAAPASQPRTIIYGQIICLSMALMGKYYLLNLAMLPIWLVVPLTAAGSIAVMTKFGLAHPPAAAVIIALFSQRDFSLISILFVLGGNVIAISVAVLVNNLSETSQYPVYWNFGIHEAIQSMTEHVNLSLSQRSFSKCVRRLSTQRSIAGNGSTDAATPWSASNSSSFLEHSYVPIHGLYDMDHSQHLNSSQVDETQIEGSNPDIYSDEEEPMVYFTY